MVTLVRRNPGLVQRARRRSLAPRRPSWAAPYWDSCVAMPIDVEEQPERYVVRASVPGFAPEDIHIHVEENELIIRAERTGKPEEQGRWYLRERFDGSLERHLRLGQDINTNAIEAELEHGVLTLTLPKAETARPRQIKVKVAAS